MVRRHLSILFWGCVVFLVVHGANFLFNGHLSQFGIVPRQPDALYHIYLAPWLHGSFGHLSNNLVGWLIFSSFVLLRSVRLYLFASFLIITLTGLSVWMWGRTASHIGASGWVFGLWSLNIAIACFDRRLLNILIAIVMVFLYGGMIYGVLPQDPGVSFESHLFGAIAGVVAAWFSRFRYFKNIGKG